MSNQSNPISPKQLAEQTLENFSKNVNYLQGQTREKVQSIEMAVIYQIPKEKDEQKKADYQALLTNVEKQLKNRQQKQIQRASLASQYIQVRKAASQITWKQMVWTGLLSVLITAAFSVITKLITGDWPWWAYLLLGILSLFLIGLIIIIFNKCRCSQQLEEEELQRLNKEKNKVIPQT